MKNYTQPFFLLSILVFTACEAANECANSDIELFDSYLHLDGETEETQLETKLGPFTNGYYSEDNTQFIYNFLAVPDAPVSVVVNAASSKVETVMMEVLTYEADFEKDLADAVETYKIDACDSRFFGMKREELISDMGEPSEEKTVEENVNMLTYFSKDYRTEVRFKFYPEQDHVCSSVIVNWYH